MFECRQIIYRMRQGESDRAIAKTGLNGWLNPKTSMPSKQEIANSIIVKNNTVKVNNKIEPYVDQINAWFTEDIKSARIIHQSLVNQYNFTGSYNCVQRHIKTHKKNKTSDITVPLYFAPGEASQVDFGQGPKIYDPKTGKLVKSWFFVMTLCFSRHQYVEIVQHQDCATWLGCHRRALVVRRQLLKLLDTKTGKISYHF